MRIAGFHALFALLPLAAFATGSYGVVTVGGSDWVGDNGPATSAILVQAEGIAIDLAGNIYIADAGDHRVRKVSPAGVITTVAGTGVAGFSGDGGPAASAELNSPYGLALDGVGDLYIADLGNARVRCVTPDGNIATIAGGGALAPGGANEGSAATAMALSAPRNVAWDGRGSLYISDFTGQRLFRLAPDGSLTTVAGIGAGGFSGDGGPATGARISYPAGIAVDASGAVYLADSGNHVIRRIANNLIATFARAATPTGLALDHFGTLYAADPGAGEIVVMPASAQSYAISFNAQDVACAFDSTVYAASTGAAWHVSFSGPSTMVAGGGSFAHGDGGAATLARLNHPAGVAVDSAGNIYIADRDNHRIRKIEVNGNITTVAGSGSPGNSGDNGPATAAQLNSPESVTVDPFGDLYIADTGNARVRVVNTAGLIFPVSASNVVSPVYALADSHGNVFIADPGAGAVVELSGGATITIAANLASPRGLALDAAGNLYVTEAGAARVDRIAPGGEITTIGAGSWNIPRGVAVAPTGDMFVADTGLQRILHVDVAGNVSIIAGNGSAGFSGDGGPATLAELNFPWDVAIDSNGNLDVADLENNRVRQLTPAAVSTPLSVPVTAVNAASLLPGPVAPGMLVDLLGTGLTPAESITTQITFNQIAAQILSITDSAVLVVAPAQLAGSTAQIQIVSNGNLLGQVSVAIVAAAPALFADPSGQALANNQDGTLNSISNPAARGSIVAFYGTGQGGAGLPVSATIGGYSAPVLYAGPVVNYPGLLQINVQIPAGYLAPGDLPVVITVGSASTQTGVRIAVN
jgi:uncharacterized protein (TIGR03437 family)